MSKITCIIIDDEPLAIKVIENYLQQVNNIDLVQTFSNAIDGLNFIKENTVDLIFLDINMPLLDGISFIKSIEVKPLIIITTAYEKFAVKTYELEVLDYLLKPIPFPRFLKAMNRVSRHLSQRKNLTQEINKRASIFIKVDKKKIKKIYLDEILVIESLKDYLKINTITESFITHQTLISFTEQLPSESFIRIHRSYTIALDKVDAIEGNSVEIGGIRYVIGRTYINNVKSRILNSSI